MVVEQYAGDAASGNISTGLRVLIADDHEMVRVAMRYALAGLAEAIEWREACDVTQARTILEQDPTLDLALVDISMPGANGIEWIRSLRRAHPTLPLLVMSATEDPRTVRALIDLGIAGFIPKSDSSAVILQAVRLVLAGG